MNQERYATACPTRPQGRRRRYVPELRPNLWKVLNNVYGSLDKWIKEMGGTVMSCPTRIMPAPTSWPPSGRRFVAVTRPHRAPNWRRRSISWKPSISRRGVSLKPTVTSSSKSAIGFERRRGPRPTSQSRSELMSSNAIETPPLAAQLESLSALIRRRTACQRISASACIYLMGLIKF